MRRALCCSLNAAIGFAPAPAHADLKLCNTTSSRVGVAIGRDVEGLGLGRLVERRLAYLRDPARRWRNCQVLLHPRYRLRSRRGMGRHLVHAYRRGVHHPRREGMRSAATSALVFLKSTPARSVTGRSASPTLKVKRRVNEAQSPVKIVATSVLPPTTKTIRALFKPAPTCFASI